MRVIIGLGDFIVVVFNGFYVDDIVLEFDMDIMWGDFYFDVG